MSIDPERPGDQAGGKRAGKAGGPAAGPTVLRIALGGQLRRLRESRGISREAAGDAIRGSHAKISRLELGRVSFRERDISDLLTYYGVQDPQEREQFLALARQANEPGWWHQYGDLLPSWFETYLGLEQAAAIIRTYEAQFVPGLLQTPDYARAVINLGHGHESAPEVDRRVALRTRRQDILTRPEPSTLWAVIDEGALRRPIGGDQVMRGQIEHLIRVAELPNVTVQVLPYSAGGHAAAGGPFSILRFPESDLPDIVYLEQLTSALYLDKRHDLDQYQAVMDKLSVQAVTPEGTPRLLREIVDSY
ncbi:helix-turn-helix domain-containing protein [Saccharopolyspora griseoalba]|uniref:Helix-turn-helix domain-containing protein n=1 Tax=Saccharopolyspora griseoalba TaxID=1431848 RepID=A0ABW2LJS1_9PSEU